MKKYTKKEFKETLGRTLKSRPSFRNLLANWPGRQPTTLQLMEQYINLGEREEWETTDEDSLLFGAQFLLFILNRDEWREWDINDWNCSAITKAYITNKDVLP